MHIIAIKEKRHHIVKNKQEGVNDSVWREARNDIITL